MNWDTWLKRRDRAATDRATDSDTQPPAREIPLCAVGSEVTLLVAKPAEPIGATFHAKAAIVDGDRIVLTGITAAKPDDADDVTLQWAVESGERRVRVKVQSSTETTWTVLAVGDVTHRQRRRWVRVRTAVSVAVRQPGEETCLAGHTLNLSAGGMAAAIETTVDEDLTSCAVDVTLHLPGDSLTVHGTVDEVIEAESGSIVRVSFCDVAEAGEEKLADYVFQVQREELARRREKATM